MLPQLTIATKIIQPDEQIIDQFNLPTLNTEVIHKLLPQKPSLLL